MHSILDLLSSMIIQNWMTDAGYLTRQGIGQFEQLLLIPVLSVGSSIQKLIITFRGGVHI